MSFITLNPSKSLLNNPNVDQIAPKIRTRFAPSPTGELHIGSIRTAFFCWLYAEAYNGIFHLRIEDTDVIRSKIQYTENIINCLQWVRIIWTGLIVYQLARLLRYQIVADFMLKNGMAYKCYCTAESLNSLRDHDYQKYDERCRDIKENLDLPYAIRLKTSKIGVTEFVDMVQGPKIIDNKELDDRILMRSDGMPTYTFAVVVDDHDMEITHVIRGNEHLTNTFIQIQLYKTLGWSIPQFGHLAVIHDADNVKLSKRRGAIGIMEYKKQGYLPISIMNYIFLLGVGQKRTDVDYDCLSLGDMIGLFKIEDINISPSKFDEKKLLHINARHMKKMPNEELWDHILALESLLLQEKIIESDKTIMAILPHQEYESSLAMIMRSIEIVKYRTNTLIEMTSYMKYILIRPVLDISVVLPYSHILPYVNIVISKMQDWALLSLQNQFNEIKKEITNNNICTFQQLAICLRMILMFREQTPSIAEIMYVLGKTESLARIQNAINISVS